MPDCLFCRIRDGQLPARKIYEDEGALAFEDISPQAPMHVLVIPRKHIPTLNDLTPEDEPLVGHLFTVAARIAEERGHAGPGWRAVMNCNSLAGQTVFHLHLHVLGGRPLEWPPG
ncbi:MAG TPA: histidine triad nucleotide-binding protein [Myxococcales bacterium]|jgi:histidine triad (HIT) family protein|nr:histidine triad nucleotide-binding protein [Myxococcales bacterium]